MKHPIRRAVSFAFLASLMVLPMARGDAPATQPTVLPVALFVLQTMNPARDSPRNAAKKYGSDRPNLQAYYDVYCHYAREHGLTLVDHYPAWRKLQLEEPGKFERAVPDGIHPSSGASNGRTWPAVEAKQGRAAANR
jgi:hypothetical protein